jgi:hypothetical protein
MPEKRIRNKNKIRQYKVVEGGLEKNNKLVSEKELQEMMKGFVSESIHLNVLIASGASLPAIPLMGNSFDKFKRKRQIARIS